MTEVVDRLERNLMSLGVYVERHALESDDADAVGERAASGDEPATGDDTAADEPATGDDTAADEPATGDDTAAHDGLATGEGPTLHLEYETAAAGLSRGDVGNVCTELVDAHGDGWEPVDCHFWVFDTDGGFLGEWTVRAGWFRALDRGDISGTDFSTLVLSTRRPAEEPPDETPAWGSTPADR